MGFNPREVNSEVNYYKIAEKCNTWSFQKEAEKWEDKIKKMRERRLGGENK